MRFKTGWFSLALALFFAVTAANVAAGDGGTLKVRFVGIEEQKGELLIAVADSRATFESETKAFRSAKIAADAAEVTATFDSVPAGDYAVKIIQDANSNGKLDIGWTGPEEKYGFSNDVMGFMGPPDYDDAKFAFDGIELTVVIKAK